MERVLLSSNTIAITPRCESGYSIFYSLFDKHLHSIPLLLGMEEKGRPEHAPMIQAILRMLHEGYAPRNPANMQNLQIEPAFFNAPLSLRKKPHFDHIVSTCNESSPTITHLPVLYGYISLIMRRIDLSVADISDLIALHCAYLAQERETIRITLRKGAPFSIKVTLGRSPRDLLPKGSYLADWLDGEIGTRESSPLIEHPIGHEIALAEQFTYLEAEKEYKNDSGRGGSNSGSDASNNNDGDEERVGPGPSVHVLWSCVSWFVLSCLIFSYLIFPLRLFHSLVPQAVM